MLKNRNIICISTIDWDFIWQGHQEIMSAFAQNGNKVIFIENTGARSPSFKDLPRIKQRVKNWLNSARGLRKEAENLYIYSPIILPFPYSGLARFINRWLMFPDLERWMKVLKFTDPIIWTYLPTPFALDLVDQFSENIVVYYCLDKFSVSSAAATKIKFSEIKILKKSDIVFASSNELFEYCSKFNNNVHLFPNSVSFKKFEQAMHSDADVPQELKGIKHPIVGYVGGIHKWIDLPLVEGLVKKFQDYSFVFAGPVQTDISFLLKQKNVYFLGQKPHKLIPYLIKNFDICIIPYQLTEYTNNVYPSKLNEYHAVGKPVVSTPLPEILNFNKTNDNLVFIGMGVEEFGNAILKAKNSNDAESIDRRLKSARSNDWELKINLMSELLNKSIEQKEQMPVDWQTSLGKFYRNSKKHILRFGVAALLLYTLIFYTPLVWFLATPLKVSQNPEPVDSIVVLAGGGGESGKAGQGYEERVKFAVELYKNGFAKKMLFCSGYIYVFKEPLVMKALAISLGANEEDIKLEYNAKNAYEHALYIKNICARNNWDKIILVSSPYHMRRLSLVFDKNARDLRVVYVPIKNSLFYTHTVKNVHGGRNWKYINLQQIKGIFHEYLAIAYYKLKGWI